LERLFRKPERLQGENIAKEMRMNTKISLTSLLAVTIAAGAASADRKAQPKPQPAAPSPAAATLKKIEATFGFVPDFVKAVPPTLLPSWWDAAVSFEDSPTTKLDAKTKQLIGLAVAAQVPCDYCIVYHTEAARANGATELELQEAVAMAASVRQNSTIVNGMQVDKVQFRRDLDRLFKSAPPQAKR
jgi:AhpD family alkylhydroperoxidase